MTATVLNDAQHLRKLLLYAGKHLIGIDIGILLNHVLLGQGLLAQGFPFALGLKLHLLDVAHHLGA